MANRSESSASSRLASLGVFIALAMLMGWIETMIPINIGIPGVKLGLANLVTIVAVYCMPLPKAAAVSLVRIVLTGFTFGSFSSLMYSMAGGVLSFLCMAAAKKSGAFGKTAVSITGGITHNIGQLLMASFVVQSFSVFWYFPVLLTAGVITGTLIGILAGAVIRRLPDSGM